MCVDPATMAMTAAAVSSLSQVGQGIVQYQQGKASEKAYKRAARSELQKTAYDESNMRQEARQFASRQRLQMLAQGGDVASGTNEAIATADARTLEMQALMRRYEGETEAENLRTQGRQAARAGTIGAGFSFISAGVEAMQGAEQWQSLKGSGGSQMKLSAKKLRAKGP